jgi:hypothetical protein
MTQMRQVFEAMQNLGGFATFGALNRAVDFTGWKTKTPEATIRRIVQESPEFFRIRPGLWALEQQKAEVLRVLQLNDVYSKEDASSEFTHTYYQGLLVEIGNLRNMNTYVPGQDKNKMFLNKPLHTIATLLQMPTFSYPEIIGRGKTVDVIWFNERNMPYAFFEVEHSTDIQNSLLKFYELQDFYAKFYIVADEHRKSQYFKIIDRSIFSPIRKRVSFASYEHIANIHTQTFKESIVRAL